MSKIWKTVLLYGAIIAGSAFMLNWLEYAYWLRRLSGDLYTFLIALSFAILGLWVGYRLFRRDTVGEFSQNDAALASLGITAREFEVLKLLGAGQSNKEIARSLNIYPNTIKTHLANIYEKLEVERRIQAIQKAQFLSLIP